jgi:hypothetical protein
MKKIIVLSSTVMLFVSSCGNCDSDPESNLQADIAGVYAISSWNAPIPTDLDQDGISSRNLMDETDCYDSSHIILSEDMSYNKSYHFAEAGGESISCNMETDAGTWSTNGSTVRLLSTEGHEVIYAYGSVNQILTRSEADWHFPVSDGDLVYLENGPVNMVFEKQE